MYSTDPSQLPITNASQNDVATFAKDKESSRVKFCLSCYKLTVFITV